MALNTEHFFVRKLTLCDNVCYHITDEDAETLKLISPGLARLIHVSDSPEAAHFVCEHRGQIPPVKLRRVHRCRSAKP